MNEQAGFLQAIRENPDDDGQRLIFADWLEDHGQPERAEFIRAQIERAKLPPRHPRHQELSLQERGLLRNFGKKWFLLPKGWKLGVQVHVRRGFPEMLEADTPILLEQGGDLISRWPITGLRPGRLGETRELPRQLAYWPYLARIRSLELYYMHAGPQVIGTVLEAPHLANLVRLKVGSNRLGDDGVRHLAHLPHLAGLRELDIRHNGLTYVGLEELTSSRFRQRTQSLCLCGNQGVAQSAIKLLSSDNWPALTDLNLWYTSSGDREVEQMAGCPALSRLTVLNLTNNGIGDQGLQALAESPHAVNLRTVLLALNRISSSSVPALINSPYLQGLTDLNLYNNGAITTHARRKLRGHFGNRVSFEKAF